jgi:hypothetical protein
MAMARFTFVLLGLLAASCAPIGPPADTSQIPPGALGTNQDSDARAVGLSSYVFADTSPSRVNPVDVARAAASVDYLAGEIATNPRYYGLPPLLPQQFAAARSELRAALGVAPSAPSQRVVNGLLMAANGMLAQNHAAAVSLLTPDVFTLGGDATLARLANLPPLPATNVATSRLAVALNSPGETNCFSCR